MRVLFFMRHAGYVRNFDSFLHELAGRGHEIEIAFDAPKKAAWLGEEDPLAALTAAHSRVTREAVPERAADGWLDVARGLRVCLDYLRYLRPEYRNSPKLRRRAAEKAPRLLRRLPGLRLAPVRRAVAAAIAAIERRVPLAPSLLRFVEGRRPDVVLVTPLVGIGSDQVDHVRAARRLGIPCGLLVTSWDNLTNKGLLHETPDIVAVWNDAQRREAVELHGLPEDRVAVTGAHTYDHWFRWQPSTTDAEFRSAAGLPADGPLLLYLCSSPFIAPDEVGFFGRWLAAVRGTGGVLSEAAVLVRPHPQNAPQWADVELADDRVSIWPRGGADPVTDDRRRAYFDSIHHARAVVGVNTSALIEAAIVGRPVFTVLDPAFETTQRGTLHFEHIAGEHGLLHLAPTLEDHVAHLAAAIAAPRTVDERARSFVETFVRPYGLDRAAAPLLADAVEGLATIERAPAATPVGSTLVRVALAPVARARAEVRRSRDLKKSAKKAKAGREARRDDERGKVISA